MIMWGSCDDHVMIMWGSCDDHVRIMWGSCEDHVRVMWGSCEDHVRSCDFNDYYYSCGRFTPVHTHHKWIILLHHVVESRSYIQEIWMLLAVVLQNQCILLSMSNCHWTVSLYFLVLNLPYFFQASVLWKENMNVNSCYSVAILGLHRHLQHSLRPSFTPLFFPGSMPPSLPPPQVYQWCSQVFSVYQPFF